MVVRRSTPSHGCRPIHAFSDMVVTDPFANLLKFLSCVTVVLVLVYSRTYLFVRGLFRGETFVLAIWPFYALSAAALYRLGSNGTAGEPRSRAFGYPVIPAIFIVAVAWFIVNALVTEPVSTGLTFAIILAGLPMYLWRFRDRNVPAR